METWKHLLFSSILAAAFYPAFNWKALLILAGGVLIDIDHYFWYIYKFRKFSFSECYKYYIEANRTYNFKVHFGILLAFHTVEFLFGVVLLSFYHEFAWLFLIGLSGHYLLDLIWHISIPKCIIANHSIIWWIVKNKLITT